MRWCPCDWFTWRDLIITIKHSGVDSDLYRSMHPNEAGWSLTNMLLATIADVLRWLQWAKTKDGARGVGAPEPIPRPGVRKKPVHPKTKGVARSRLRALMGRKQPQEAPDRATRLAELFSGKA